MISLIQKTFQLSFCRFIKIKSLLLIVLFPINKDISGVTFITYGIYYLCNPLSFSILEIRKNKKTFLHERKPELNVKKDVPEEEKKS